MKAEKVPCMQAEFYVIVLKAFANKLRLSAGYM